MCCASARGQRSIVEECMKWVINDVLTIIWTHKSPRVGGSPSVKLLEANRCMSLLSSAASWQVWSHARRACKRGLRTSPTKWTTWTTRSKRINLLGTWWFSQHSCWPCWLVVCRSQIAFLKSYSTRCGQDTARDAVQIFGGRGVTKTGMGKFIEHVCLLYRACQIEWYVDELNGQIVSQNNPFWFDSWRNWGCPGGSWCQTGDEAHAQECETLIWCNTCLDGERLWNI